MNPAEAASPDLLKNLVDALRQGATPAPAWFLTHQERWRWLVETLMGHPRIRGGQRPRDYPGDPFSKRLLTQVVDLHQLTVPSWKGKLPKGVRFGSWLFAYALIVETQVLAQPDPPKVHEAGQEPGLGDSEGILAQALDWVIWQLLQVLDKRKDEAAYHLLLATLGISPVEAPKLSSQGPGQRPSFSSLACEESLRIAAQAALHAGAGADGIAKMPVFRKKPEGPQPKGRRIQDPTRRGTPEDGVPDNNKVVALLDGKVWTLFLKASNVQSFLWRAKVLWMARGASAWVSQVVAAARYRLSQETHLSARQDSLGPLLLTDVGAFSFHASSRKPDCRRVLEEIVLYLGKNLDMWNPKLAAFKSSHPEFGLDDQGIRSCFPDLCLEATRISIRRLCVRGMAWNAGVREARRTAKEKARLRYLWMAPEFTAAGKACGFVRKRKPLNEGEKPTDDGGLLLVDQVPWRKGDEDHSSIGWCGIAWSLAGTTYKAHTIQGFAEILERHGIRTHDTHGEWLKGMGMGGEGTTYLFLDGNRVGKTFARLPPILGFQVALDLLHHTQEGLLEGIREVCASVGPHAPLATLPVELIYLGGDDLVCSMPTRFLPLFLEGFHRHAKSQGARSFTGIGIQVPFMDTEVARKAQAPIVGLLLSSLKWAKDTTRKSRHEEAVKTYEKLLALAADEGLELKRLRARLASRRVLTVLGLDLRPIPAAPETAP